MNWGEYKWRASAERDAASGQSLRVIRLSGLQEREVTAAIAAYETHGWLLDLLTATGAAADRADAADTADATDITDTAVTYHVHFRRDGTHD